ncbi:MAG: hypothetical protein HY340_01735 [Candidatus Kerfeldbacteria bacterium]|nr:hypothetical protein [Candidatus Kerfeldbacteria bacterium]
MLINVYPLKRLPRSLGPFTYQVPVALQRNDTDLVGAWVRIPFRGSGLDGIVWSREQRAPENVKRIAKVSEILPYPRLTREQRLILEFFWEQLFQPIGSVLWALFPTRPKTERGKIDIQRPPANAALTLSRVRSELISAAAADDGHPRFLRLTDLAERVAFILSLLRTTRRDRQTLVLASTHDDAYRLWSVLTPRLRDRAVLLTGALTPAQRWAAWTKAATHKNGLFISTKIGVLAPYQRLANILIDRAADDGHTQADQNPRYNAQTVARELARLHESRLVLFDAQPTLAHWADPEVRLAESPAPVPQSRTIVHRAASRGTGGAGFFSDKALQSITASTGAVAVLHNRKGYATLVRCQECGWLLRCPVCALLIGTRQRQSPRCQRCGTGADIPAHCPTCGSTRLAERGGGIERIAAELREHFPGRRIVTLDRETEPTHLDGDIVVATEKLLYWPALPRFALLVVPDVDAHLLYPDVRTVERAFLILERAAALLLPNAHAIFQTHDPGQPIIGSLRTRDPQTLYTDELELRKRLALPPAMRVLRLLGGERSAAAVTASAHDVLASLRTVDPGAVRISPALAPVPEKRGTRHRRTILVTILSGQATPDTLRDVLMKLPDTWFVDPEPLSLNP